MKAASVDQSPRLQRVLRVLEDGRPHSTRDLVVSADVCAVNSCIAELRANGYLIDCRRRPGPTGPTWFYQLLLGREKGAR